MRKIPVNKARQGRRGKTVLTILLSSLVLVGIVWMGVELYGNKIDTRPENVTGSDSSPPENTQPSTTQ